MEKLYALWLLSIMGTASRTSAMLCEYFTSFEEIYNATEKELESSGILNGRQIENLQNKSPADANSVLTECEMLGIDIVTAFDVQYPKALKNIDDYPILLFYKGYLPTDKDLMIGLVGSRRPSLYGLKMSEKIAYDLGCAGVVIVSGMARGIDSSSHKGALRANAKTIAVLGCGIDVVYPPENRELEEYILQNGAVLSEYPPHTPPLPQHFPVRNRLISGISDAVIVIEGKATSGSTITANIAKNQGREVFCLPGNADNPLSVAPNRLIREGARLITCAQDVLIDLAIDNPEHLTETIYRETSEEEKRKEKIDSLTADQRRIVNVMSETMSVHIDEICFKTGIEVAVVTQSLFMLELKGFVKQLPGKQYILCL